MTLFPADKANSPSGMAAWHVDSESCHAFTSSGLLAIARQRPCHYGVSKPVGLPEAFTMVETKTLESPGDGTALGPANACFLPFTRRQDKLASKSGVRETRRLQMFITRSLARSGCLAGGLSNDISSCKALLSACPVRRPTDVILAFTILKGIAVRWIGRKEFHERRRLRIKKIGMQSLGEK